MTMTEKMRNIKKSEASLNYLEHIAEIARRLPLVSAELKRAKELGLTWESERLTEMCDRLIGELDEASRLLETLDTVEGDILRDHYIYRQELADIGKEVGYSRSSVVRYAASGRVKIYDSLPERWKRTVVF